jgi:hypothetical protein
MGRTGGIGMKAALVVNAVLVLALACMGYLLLTDVTP